MIQSLLMLLAPAREMQFPETPPARTDPDRHMATRPAPETHRQWRRKTLFALSIAGNALGFLLLLATLGLSLRLAEVLLS